MKKLLLLVTLAFCGIDDYAQPVLTRNKMPAPGSVVKYKYSNSFSRIDTTIKGANATWDFSSMVPNGDLFEIAVLTPAQTPYGASFTNANYAYKETPTAYSYFKITPEIMERVGSYRSALKTFSDPQTEYVFPLQMGTSSLDDWANSQSSFGGTYYFNCVGYGTLKLPGGVVHNNVLMVAVVITEIFDIPAYYWYSSENGATLLSYVVGDGIFISETVMYANEITNGNNALNEVKPFGDVYYTNPVTNYLELHFPQDVVKNATYQIKNMEGRVVGNAGQFSTSAMASIDMSGLAKGLYLVELKDENGNAQQFLKVLKQ